MTLVDTNVWLSLALSEHDFHKVAVDWLETEKHAGKLVFCRSTQQSFLRLLTTASVIERFGIPPLTNSQAWQLYQGFLSDRRISFVEEPAQLEREWIRLAGTKQASPKIWMDAYLAAFAISG